MEARLYRVILPVRDVDKAEEFYSAILNQKGKRVLSGRYYFDIGGTILACYDPKSDGDVQGRWQFHENQHIYISTPDLESVREKMKVLECKALGKIENMPWWGNPVLCEGPFWKPNMFCGRKNAFHWRIDQSAANKL